MRWFKSTLEINTRGKGLYPFTRSVIDCIHQWQIQNGMCYLYLQHTSASLVIGENYDPSAREDMQSFLDRLVPENQAWFRHTLEGADDSPAHLRAMITPTSQVIPIDDGDLSLGTWQGIYLFEHRSIPHRRQVLIRCLSADDPIE
jgi:secondary thiamine-phosphate synthase enzyme